jgi:hypothetical protein
MGVVVVSGLRVVGRNAFAELVTVMQITMYRRHMLATKKCRLLSRKRIPTVQIRLGSRRKKQAERAQMCQKIHQPEEVIVQCAVKREKKHSGKWSAGCLLVIPTIVSRVSKTCPPRNNLDACFAVPKNS